MYREIAGPYVTWKGFQDTVKQKMGDVQDYLLLTLGVTMVLSVTAGAFLAMLIALTWAVSGTLKDHWSSVRKNPVALSFLAFYALHLLGLLWTEDFHWGVHMVGKQWRLLLVPILICMMRKEHADLYLSAFLTGMTLAHLVSYMNILGLTDLRIQTHVTYNVLLAIASYILLQYILFRDLSSRKQLLLTLLFISFSINMFATIGRMGQMAYLLCIGIVLIQYNKKNMLKGIIISIILIPFLFGSIYYLSSTFKSRIDAVIHEIVNFEMNKPSEYFNDRITFYLNTLEIIRENPLIGVGTGDFPKEYSMVNKKNSPNVVTTVNPHNNYMLVISQFGIPGILVFISIFYFQILFALRTNDQFSNLRIALPIIFLFVMNTDSYMMSYYTSMVYVYMSGFLYK